MAKKEKQIPITDLIAAYYNENIRLLPPLKGECELPDPLVEVLRVANGIMENMLHPQTGNPMDIGWIVYPYAMILVESEMFSEKYRIKGYVFADDGIGNPYYIRENHVFFYDTMEKQETIVAPSLAAFFRREEEDGFSLDPVKIAACFAQNDFPTEQGELISALAVMKLPPHLQQYLRMMQKTIKLHVSPHGTPATTLHSQDIIAMRIHNETLQPILDHGYFLIGRGANSDALCVNLQNGNVAFVMYRALEKGKADFAEICTELPMPLDIFLEMAFTDKQYPFDGKTAREYLDSHTKR
ncbi:MAG: SMI1/KNR4 family protein [Oscillospiraceae bacterium]|nr:SMI1/KNR4 family protein [Oscillospiraceae bacterium]